MNIFKLLLVLSVFFVNSLYAQKPYVEKELLNKITKKYKMFAKKRFVYLQKSLDKVKDGDDLQKLEAVNKFYNGVRYMSDK